MAKFPWLRWVVHLRYRSCAQDESALNAQMHICQHLLTNWRFLAAKYGNVPKKNFQNRDHHSHITGAGLANAHIHATANLYGKRRLSDSDFYWPDSRTHGRVPNVSEPISNARIFAEPIPEPKEKLVFVDFLTNSSGKFRSLRAYNDQLTV